MIEIFISDYRFSYKYLLKSFINPIIVSTSFNKYTNACVQSLELNFFVVFFISLKFSSFYSKNTKSSYSQQLFHFIISLKYKSLSFSQ